MTPAQEIQEIMKNPTTLHLNNPMINWHVAQNQGLHSTAYQFGLKVECISLDFAYYLSSVIQDTINDLKREHEENLKALE